MRATLALVLLAAAPAHADDDTFILIGIAPQIGAGIGTKGLDGTVRWGAVARVTDRFRPGGFVEVHTVNFDGLDAAIGPQVQLRLDDSFALQLRAGVGGVANGPSFATAGVQLGNFVAGASVTARRYFDDDHVELAVDFEVTSLLLLLPFVDPWPSVE